MAEAATLDKDLKVTNRGIEMPIKLLSVQKGFNVRENTTPDKEFLASIKENGILRPLHIRVNPKKGGEYLVVDGERRFNAATKLGLDTVPVIPEGELEDAHALVISLIANEGHRSFTPREVAAAFQRLKEADIDDEEIARVMGYEVRKVKETLRVLEKGDEALVEALQADEKEERIPPRAAARAADLPKKTQKKLVKEMKGKNVSEGLKVVRREEKKLGAKKRGRKAEDYELAPGTKKTCMLLEATLKAHLKQHPNNARAVAHMEILSLLKGKVQLTELYPDAAVKILEGGKKEAKAPKAARTKKVSKKASKKKVKKTK